ncbi:ATP-binding protein [Flavobacterium terrigena]|uniref:histidine kinase n=1 Tax=Flavobacterium terrigena TaxID=402734 RepID=A0A1H6UDB5_9FLAO|nr:ATP-binding protein [Flavobacterium terrigena]SEI87647.1 Signal transduction histidine kinase [Flavobacterium terrigena]
MNIIVRNLRNSTYLKVVTLLSVVSFGLLLIVVFLYFYMRVQEKEIFKNSKELYQNEINSLLKLNSESYSAVVNDATYWDEFVKFTQTKDLKWFNTSIAILIDTYDVEHLSAYSADGEFITKVSTLKIKTKDFIPKEVFSLIKEKKFEKFYIRIPEGIVEIYGASIHPSNDPFKNKTKPSGYFFMARLLDRDYFANIEEICSSKIKFYTGKERALKTVFTTIPLLDINKREVAKLYFKRSYDIDFYITKSILCIMAMAIILSWGIFFFYANKWAQVPLELIKRILKGDTVAIEKLKKIKGEFRHMGKLFEENLNQKTELIASKIKAEESDKLKSAFLMNLSHEIRTPMNAIVGFSDLLLDEKTTEFEKHEYVRIIQYNSRSLLSIVDDLIEMSKIDSDLIKPNYSNVSLEKLLKAAYESASFSNKNSNVVVKLQEPSEKPKRNIVTDAVKLNQILVNLLNNALKFTDEGFVILDYEIDPVKNLIIFEVKDSGIGMPEEFKEKIFKRFNKINAKKISANEGLGLGLAISKSYVEMLGGTISVETKEGLGSTFRFTIPLQYATNDNAEVKKVNSIENYTLGNEEVVLVAEDDNINFKLIEKLLKIFNFKVIRAVDGLEAVEICRTHNEIDLVFMDIKMPNLDGYGAFQKIREFNKEIPIIAQTSYSFPEEVDKIKELGFNDFISKPLEKEKLYELVKKYFNK